MPAGSPWESNSNKHDFQANSISRSASVDVRPNDIVSGSLSSNSFIPAFNFGDLYLLIISKGFAFSILLSALDFNIKVAPIKEKGLEISNTQSALSIVTSFAGKLILFSTAVLPLICPRVVM